MDFFCFLIFEAAYFSVDWKKGKKVIGVYEHMDSGYGVTGLRRRSFRRYRSYVFLVGSRDGEPKMHGYSLDFVIHRSCGKLWVQEGEEACSYRPEICDGRKSQRIARNEKGKE